VHFEMLLVLQKFTCAHLFQIKGENTLPG